MEEILQKANAYEDQGVLVTNILFDVFFWGYFQRVQFSCYLFENIF